MAKYCGDNLAAFVQSDISDFSIANLQPLSITKHLEFETDRNVLVFIVILLLFVPIIIIFTMNITSGMMKYSRLFNEKVVIYKNEKKKTEKLLSTMLPLTIIKQLKRG